MWILALIFSLGLGRLSILMRLMLGGDDNVSWGSVWTNVVDARGVETPGNNAHGK
jgi:hypothetical protein